MAYHPQPYVITDNGDPALHMWFLSYLIEGRAEAAMSYGQYLGHLKERVTDWLSGRKQGMFIEKEGGRLHFAPE
ncbi:hypothetical protein BGX31_007029 [Mortierella sp. GBA43]|nr:hypothetical protein BGX31_007029 [Mortierella sp. GBA43]